MASALQQLAQAIIDRRAILFVGAGVSMSVGLPSWQKLIEHLVEELGLDKNIIAEANVTYQMLAEFYRLKQGSIGPLRSWMDRNWSVSREKVEASEIHKLIVALDFPIIYTTNYDRNLEAAFEIRGRPYVKVANAKDIAKSSDAATQIIKYHGDFDDDSSLILAETDYFERLSFDSPLDVEFRADALGRTILFIGYSMSDLNIRLLLHRLWETRRLSGYENDRPKSFAFMHRPGVVQEAVLGLWGIEMLSENAEQPEHALTAFLSRLADRVADSRDEGGAKEERNFREAGMFGLIRKEIAMNAKLPPTPAANQSPKGTGDKKQVTVDDARQEHASAPDPDKQGQQGNSKVNTTHQGNQQDR